MLTRIFHFYCVERNHVLSNRKYISAKNYYFPARTIFSPKRVFKITLSLINTLLYLYSAMRSGQIYAHLFWLKVVHRLTMKQNLLPRIN